MSFLTQWWEDVWCETGGKTWHTVAGIRLYIIIIKKKHFDACLRHNLHVTDLLKGVLLLSSWKLSSCMKSWLNLFLKMRVHAQRQSVWRQPSSKTKPKMLCPLPTVGLSQQRPTLLNCYSHYFPLNTHTHTNTHMNTQIHTGARTQTTCSHTDTTTTHTRRSWESKVSKPLRCGQKLSELWGAETRGWSWKKYPSLCCGPTGRRRVVVPTTSAPGRRQHRAAEWALASAWTEPFTQPEQPSALAARSLFPSRTELHGVSRCVRALPLSSAALRRALTTASCLPPLLGGTDQ